MAAATADVVSRGSSRASTSTRWPASSSRSAQESPMTPAPTTTTLPMGLRLGSGGPRGGGIGVAGAGLAGDVLLDVLQVVLVAGHHGEQVGHRRDLLDLLLDEPLEELLGGEVGLLAGDAEQAVDLLGHPLLLLQ